MRGVTVIIPAYKPDEKLLATLDGVLAMGFSDIVVVDDGGGEAFAPIFAEVRRKPHCTVLTHPVNRGKGAALRTAFRYVLENRPDISGAVTADADGQHLPEDILAVSRRMAETGRLVLGCRNFADPKVPPRSRAGNRITTGVFRLFFGARITDTQTGLRAFPRDLLPVMAAVHGDRYEYETHMLFRLCRDRIPHEEVTIATVYLDDNASSHFRAVRDSARIYRLLLTFAASSLVCTAIDGGLLGVFAGVAPAFAAGCAARGIALCLNWLLNTVFVFGSPAYGGRTSVPRSLVRYLALALPLLLLTSLAAGLTGMLCPPLTLPLRLLLGLALFPLSFRLQHNRIFRP